MFVRDQAICPRCGTDWEVDPSAEEYEENPTIYCPSCDMEITRMMYANTPFWYEISETRFAELYLRLRGYTGIPKSWYAVGCVIKRFLNEITELPEPWKGKECFEEAYEIVNDYYEKEIILCKHCGSGKLADDEIIGFNGD